MKRFVGYIIDKAVKAAPRSKKVAPDIKSVKPTSDLKGSAERTKSKEYIKRIKKLDKAQDKVSEGKKMMKEGQKERKGMVATGKAFQFKGVKSFHPMKPGDKGKYKDLMAKDKPQKKFKKGKDLK